MRFADRLAEAFAQGEPLSTLPPGDRPADEAAAWAVQDAVLDSLGFAACGLRLVRGMDGSWISGPVLEGRLVASGSVVPLSAFHHPRVSAGVLLSLRSDVERPDALTRALGALHPVLDLADSRYAEGPPDALWQAADLAGLGMIAVGPPRRATKAALRAAGSGFDLEALLRRGIDDAGGLPAGAILLIASLSDHFAPEAGEVLTGDVPGAGTLKITVA